MKQKITASVSAILIALSLVGLNADQAIAQGKARKGAKVRAGSDARITKTQGQAKLHLEDISLGVMDKPQTKRRGARKAKP